MQRGGFLNFLTMNSIFSELPVSEIMTRGVTSVNPDASLSDVLTIFEDHPFHHIPVVAGGKLQGIISKSDFYRVSHVLQISWDGQAKLNGREQRQFLAQDIMTKQPLELQPEDTIGLAADIILSNKFHALPVVSDGRLVGILTAHDLLEYAYGESGRTKKSKREFQDL